ncbi:MAG TPA: STAS domain-containing protein [Turneriella sp.]|nr:STAS domain-containing protein [Turneriella sp.]
MPQGTFKIIQIAAQEGRGVVALKGNFTIRYAKEAFFTLLEFFNKFDALALDLSGIESIDSAGFQVLLVLKKESEAQQKKVKLIRHSAPVVDMIELYGAMGLFRDKIVVAQNNRFRYGREIQHFT